MLVERSLWSALLDMLIPSAVIVPSVATAITPFPAWTDHTHTQLNNCYNAPVTRGTCERTMAG